MEDQALMRLIEKMPGMVYCCRVLEQFNYVLEFVSPKSLELLGYSPEDLTRHQRNAIERMMHPEDLVRIREELRQALIEGRPYQLNYRITTAMGETKWIWDQGEALDGERDKTKHIGGLMVDVSAQKTQEIKLIEENERLRSSIEDLSGFGGLVGVSKAMQKVYQLVKMAAASDSGVIIYGETGTGKNLVAKTIHDLSGRKGRFVPVNCGAIPEQLLESEFFGYVKGAFSGAASDHKGYLASADGGTLFLDEIGELSLHLQVKLLWALESRLFTPLGSNAPRRSEFRIIAATNRNLKDLVNEKKMRPDFFYRIQVLPIHLPALRERPEDINVLIDAFLVRYSRGDEVRPGLPKSLRSTMNRYHWPGNVRELQHFIERYLTFGDAVFSDPLSAPEAAFSVDLPPDGQGMRRMKETRDQIEWKTILEALNQCRWRRSAAARMLGISLRTLYRKMSRLGLKESLSPSAGPETSGSGGPGRVSSPGRGLR